jgi:hypothetical protein
MTNFQIIMFVARATFAIILGHPAFAEHPDFRACLIDDETAGARCLSDTDWADPLWLELRLWIIRHRQHVETSQDLVHRLPRSHAALLRPPMRSFGKSHANQPQVTIML